MTRAAKRELPFSAQRQMARLMQLHQQTHPERIGKRFDVTGEYVRRVWSNLPADEQAALDEVLLLLK